MTVRKNFHSGDISTFDNECQRRQIVKKSVMTLGMIVGEANRAVRLKKCKEMTQSFSLLL